MDDDSTAGSEQLTVERYNRRQKRTHRRLYGATPESVEVTAELLPLLVDFVSNRIKDNPPPEPPDELNERLGRACADNEAAVPTVALAILAPVLNAFARGWTDYDSSWKTILAKEMGESLCNWLALQDLKRAAEQENDNRKRRLIENIRKGRRSTHKFLQSEWTSTQCVVAGDWMLRVATRLPCFDEDERGRPCIIPEWQDRVDQICEHLLYRFPVMLPHTTPPQDWTGWWATPGDRLRAPWVRDWRPETRRAHEATFAAAIEPPATASGPFADLSALTYSLPFAHADGVNALQNVPLRINQSLLPLVEKFAVELMGHDGDKQKADRRTVRADLRHARWVTGHNGSVYLGYNCDKRGRIFSVQQLNYARQDHVRALFEFDRGEPLSADGAGGVEALHWLEIHCANCGPGEVDKKPWADRLRWAKEHTDLIERVAADPQNSFDLWRRADQPFSFAAACQELVCARRDPIGFVTHRPIGFDCTASGIQHLAMLARDVEAARLVNLIDSSAPQDIYSVVAQHIMFLIEREDRRLFKYHKEHIDKDTGKLIEAYDNEWCYAWWRERLGSLNPRERRKLFKSPIMTFAYSVSAQGMADKLLETYRDLSAFKYTTWPQDIALRFLAKAVRTACEDILPGPTKVMKYIRALALHRFKQGKFLEWRGGTGFWFANMYQEPRTVDVDLPYGGVRSRYTVADGALDEPKKIKMLNAASPNFIHSLDATHLIRTVLAANSEGIRDILTVHDCFACLAPHARRFGQIARREFAALYIVGDPLAAVRDANVDDPKLLPLPPRGNLNPHDVQNAEYPIM